MSVAIDRVSPIFYHPVVPTAGGLIPARIETPRSLNCSRRKQTSVELPGSESRFGAALTVGATEFHLAPGAARAFVILNPCQIGRVDKAAANLACSASLTRRLSAALAEHRPARSRFIDWHDRMST
jgi:hypothetical protein